MECDSGVDLERGVTVPEETLSNSGLKRQAKALISKLQFGFWLGFSPNAAEESANSTPNASTFEESSTENPGMGNCKKQNFVKTNEKDRRKSLSNKKPPKPPRPPRGPSLDAADQKLIKELAELAMLKRARIERLRALKKAKAAKSSSSNGSAFAMIFTVLFCLVIVFQGMSPQGASNSFHGSPTSSALSEANNLVSVQYVGNPPANETNRPPILVEQAAMGVNSSETLIRAALHKDQ